MAESSISVTILSPQETVFSGKAQAVFLPGILGQFEILPNHFPIISTLTEGKIILRELSGAQKDFTVSKGIARLDSNELTICVD